MREREREVREREREKEEEKGRERTARQAKLRIIRNTCVPTLQSIMITNVSLVAEGGGRNCNLTFTSGFHHVQCNISVTLLYTQSA